TVDVPREVDQEITSGEVFTEKRSEIVSRDAIPDKCNALAKPRLESRLILDEIHDADELRINANVTQKNGQRAPCDRSKSHEQDSMRKWHHLFELSLCA